VDDEEDMLRLLKRSLTEEFDCEIETARSGLRALELLEKGPFDVLLADVRMPGMNGMQLLERARSVRPDLTVVLMTAYGSIDLAVEAIKKGAYDFITKPFEHDKAAHLFAKALERSRLVSENRSLQRRIKETESFHEMVGAGPKIKRIFDTIRLISKTDVTVLLTGESGTGKDMAARAIHALSARAERAFIPINCPNLPESILESELFGHRKGAFTHATHDKKGLFQEAQGGTIYLDEIGDISPTLQTKLLRVLQEKEIRPLGQNASIKVDVRIIASTNRDLEQKIKDNLFREDLLYRLNVVSLHLPPLRERSEDIPILANHFLKRACVEFHKPPKSISPALMSRFISHKWRGNVRELQNTVSRCVLLSPGDEILPEDIDWGASEAPDCLVTDDVMSLPFKEAKAQVVERFHREYLSAVLARHGGNVTRAARDCGIERQALQQLMRRYGITAGERSTSRT
jgi:DNA-binding NtrC family response regulator